jgi:ubiquinone/menaquinone biosynthesis C-methylase UbiE
MIAAVAGLYLGPLCQEVLQAFPGPARIVDAGAGTGQLATMLARGNPDCAIVAVDLSKACLRSGRRKALEHGLEGRVTFVQADLERCPVVSGSADLVLSTCSLHHGRRPVRVLRELRRLVKPSGQIWLMDDSAEATRQARRDWVAAVETAAQPGPLFRLVFWFESRYLAYSRDEVSRLCAQSGLGLQDFALTGPFFLARMVRREASAD